jgi:sigma-E factor negative regulatory protein RseC
MSGDGGQAQEVEALNPVNARVGDRIQIAIGSGSLLKAMFLLYLFPIICMLAGGLLGNWAAPGLSLNPSIVSVLTALASLVLAMLIVRAGGQRMAAKPAYRPHIVRILGRDNGAVMAPPASDPATVAAPNQSQKG